MTLRISGLSIPIPNATVATIVVILSFTKLSWDFRRAAADIPAWYRPHFTPFPKSLLWIISILLYINPVSRFSEVEIVVRNDKITQLFLTLLNVDDGGAMGCSTALSTKPSRFVSLAEKPTPFRSMMNCWYALQARNSNSVPIKQSLAEDHRQPC